MPRARRNYKLIFGLKTYNSTRSTRSTRTIFLSHAVTHKTKQNKERMFQLVLWVIDHIGKLLRVLRVLRVHEKFHNNFLPIVGAMPISPHFPPAVAFFKRAVEANISQRIGYGAVGWRAQFTPFPTALFNLVQCKAPVALK